MFVRKEEMIRLNTNTSSECKLYYQCNWANAMSADVRVSGERRSKRLSAGAEREEEEHDKNDAENGEDDHSHNQIHTLIGPVGIVFRTRGNLIGLIEHVS